VESAAFSFLSFAYLSNFCCGEKILNLPLSMAVKFFYKYRYTSGDLKFLVVGSAAFFLFIFCLPQQFLLF